MFNVGDIVKFISVTKENPRIPQFYALFDTVRHGNTSVGVDYFESFAKIERILKGTAFEYAVGFIDNNGKSVCLGFQGYDLGLVNKINKNITMNIIEKFKLALKSEPQKSFRKAGITNGDDILTEDGQKIFLSWLLNEKYAADFKKEVVDGLLEDEK